MFSGLLLQISLKATPVMLVACACYCGCTEALHHWYILEHLLIWNTLKLLFHGELIELWCPLFFTINCKLLKEMRCTWIKAHYSEVGVWSMMSVLLCSSGVSGRNQTFLWRPVCGFKSWAGSVVSGDLLFVLSNVNQFSVKSSETAFIVILL